LIESSLVSALIHANGDVMGRLPLLARPALSANRPEWSTTADSQGIREDRALPRGVRQLQASRILVGSACGVVENDDRDNGVLNRRLDLQASANMAAVHPCRWTGRRQPR
jgi:hypothetical protein